MTKDWSAAKKLVSSSTVTQLGDTTFGIFSDNPKRELPNGWIYSVSSGDFRAADGKSYEGIGVAPEFGS